MVLMHMHTIPHPRPNRTDTGIQPPSFNQSVPSCNRVDEYYAHPLARKYQLEFKNCYQQLTQTFEMYADELKFLASGAFPVYPTSVVQCMLKAQFRIGLLKDSTIRDFPRALDSCETIEEMVQQAVCHERKRNEKLFSQLRQLYGIETATQGYSQANEMKSETQGYSQPNEIKTVTQGFSQPNKVIQNVQEVETQDKECAHKLKESVSMSINQLTDLENLSNLLTPNYESKDTIVNGQVRYCPYTRTCSSKQNRPCKMKHCNKVTLNSATINEHNCDMTYTLEQLYLEDLFSENTARKWDKAVSCNLEMTKILNNTEIALAKLYSTQHTSEQSSIRSESETENQNNEQVSDAESCESLPSSNESESKSQILEKESEALLLSNCQKVLQLEIIYTESEMIKHGIKSLQCKQFKKHVLSSNQKI